MPIQIIDRGTPGNPSDTFKVGEAFDTCQANDQYLDLRVTNLSTNTVATLAVLSLEVGSKISTKGCLTIGDDGHGDFIVESASGTPDGYSRVLLANGNHAVLMAVNGCVDIRQFGIEANMANALLRADVYCQETKNKLTGSGTATLATQVTLSAPNIDLYNFKIRLANSFPTSPAVIYQAMTNDLNSRSDVALAFDGNYVNQVSDVIALRVRATPNGPNFKVFGDQCNTLLNINGNVERGHFMVTCTNTDIFVLEDGDSPDTNVIEINGGQFKQVYVKTLSTTSDVRINCQSQKAGANVYAVSIEGNRYTKISGELRALTYGAVQVGNDPAFVRQSADANIFDLHVQSVDNAGVPIVSIQEANFVGGRIVISFGHFQPVILGDIAAANLEIETLDCDYVGYHVIFGIQATTKTCQGNYTLMTRGSAVGAKAALFDRVGNVNVLFDSSAIPIDVTATVTNDVLNLSLPYSYVASNVAVTTNGVRVNCMVRGLHATATINAYTTKFSGLCMMNRSAGGTPGGLVFYDGAVFQRSTLTPL